MGISPAQLEGMFKFEASHARPAVKEPPHLLLVLGCQFDAALVPQQAEHAVQV
jgi:hypothetical protein